MRTTPSELHTIVSKDTNYEYHIDNQRRLYWWWNDSSRQHAFDHDDDADRAEPVVSRRRHLRVGRAAHLHRRRRCRARRATTRGRSRPTHLPFYVGTDWNLIGARVRRLHRRGARDRRCADASRDAGAARRDAPVREPARFTITHNAFGINCVAETVTVDVVDATAGTPLLNYNAPVQLDTQSGYGTWALVTRLGRVQRRRGRRRHRDLHVAARAVASDVHAVLPARAAVDRRRRLPDQRTPGSATTTPRARSCSRRAASRVTAAALANPPGAVAPFASDQDGGHELRAAPRGVRPNAERSRVRHHRRLYGREEPEVLVAVRRIPRPGTRNVTIDGAARRRRKRPRARRA